MAPENMANISNRLMSFSKIIGLTFAAMLFSVSSSFSFASDNAHAALTEADFPGASKCGTCHEKIYREWTSSSHANAAISPVFHKFEQAINNLAPTISHFCVRCHQTVGTTLGEPREINTWDRTQVSREGVTCVTCHRVDTAFYKSNGQRKIKPGSIFEPVYGAKENVNLAKVIEDKGYYKVATDSKSRGKKIHTKALANKQLSKSEFCASCHQVAVNLGVKLEVVWDQYRASPAHAEGVSCQACHMGKVPGVDSGYEKDYIAVIKGKPVGEKVDHHNHAFYGPGYSIAHPGLFPHNPDAENWTPQEWLTYDYRAGWGTEEFEDKIEEDGTEIEFPEIWADRVDREDARAVIEENLVRTREKADLRRAVMENGAKLDGPFFTSEKQVGKTLAFNYVLKNTNNGHNLPSGSLGAQPELWLNVALADPSGKRIWESGYVDSNGDMADVHSLDVRAGKIKFDDQLFNLQTKFLTTNVKGTDREMYLPVNFDVDQLPLLRPAAQPTTVMNHPPFVRMEGRSIPPLGEKTAEYSVPGELIGQAGTYKLSIRMRSRAEPIYFMRFIGATPEMEQAMNEWMIDMHAYTVEFQIQ
jgi:hypothetical protein